MRRKDNLNRISFSIFVLVFILSNTYITFAGDTVIVNREKTLVKREIAADSLRWEYEQKIAVFTGNVIMNGEEGEIRCLKMTVFFDEEDEIEKMVAEGTATLIREKQKCGGEIMEISPFDNLIILKNGAWISSDKALFKGEEISFDTTKDIIKITKGVKGEIQTESDEEIENQ